jgi:hypothetical protein
MDEHCSAYLMTPRCALARHRHKSRYHRTSHCGIVNDLAEAGYVIKGKDSPRNRYQVQEYLPLPDALEREQAIGQVLDLLTGQENLTD